MLVIVECLVSTLTVPLSHNDAGIGIDTMSTWTSHEIYK